MNEYRQRQDVIGAPIDVAYWGGAVATLLRWAAAAESRYVCLCNVHSVVTAQSDARLAASVRGADLALPDGAPVAWLMRKSGVSAQQRVSGPDLMWSYFAAAAVYRESIFLYGGSTDTLERLSARIAVRFPGLRVVGTHSPPYRPLTPEEDQAEVDMINASGATSVWVSLGCPKQELWMAEHRGRIRSVLVGVGAAFGFHAGTSRRAPVWVRRLSLEWLHRLLSEPRRLWRRYLRTNTLFVVAAARQLMRR
ncbi:MAG: WecB/TagA/CpsF family glycosyltransferase [Bacteriovorax sp.]|nr:WecB/TagA/CpsF family glycosyltransferase [Rhizobacter sp.]